MTEPAIIAMIDEARAHLGAARMQVSPTDDPIIVGHIEAAYSMLCVAAKLMEGRS